MLQQQFEQRPTGTDYQGVYLFRETFGKHFMFILHVLNILRIKVQNFLDFRHVLHVFLAEYACFNINKTQVASEICYFGQKNSFGFRFKYRCSYI